MKKNNIKTSLLAFFLMVSSLPLIAGPAHPDSGDDPMEPASIDNWIFLLIIVAVVLIFYWSRHRKTIEIK